jgi:hypothetical protein
LARQRDIRDTIVLNTIVRRNGTIDVQRVVNDGIVPEDMLGRAIASIRQWDIEPGRMNGRQVDVFMNIELNIDCR